MNSSEKCWLKLFYSLSENHKRWFAAQKAVEMGYGGITYVNTLTGLSRTTITRGIKEISSNNDLLDGRTRCNGGGRKKVEDVNKKIITTLNDILESDISGDPMNSLVWVSKSIRKIEDELREKNFDVGRTTVNRLLHDMDYSLQGNKKSLNLKKDPNRDEQFKYINKLAKRFGKNSQPVISVDTKKKELVGNFKNSGRTWNKKGEPTKVLDHDFRSDAKGMAVPYGTYDIAENEGFVNVGMSSDTSEFAVNSIYQWWKCVGKKRYPSAKELLICADGGGSNGSTRKAWKYELHKLFKKTGLIITVCHYPPGASKWNKIEHKMFSFISLNWKGKPLETYETIVNLIGSTSTKKGLKIKSKLDKKKYEKGIKISKQEMNEIKIKAHEILPQWNYTIGK